MPRAVWQGQKNKKQKQKKTNNPIKKRAKDLNRHFSKEDIQMANRYVKRLNITDYQRNANQKLNELSPHTCYNGYYQKNNKCWRGYGEKETLRHCLWDYKLVQPLWKTVCSFLKKLRTELPYEPAIPFLGIHLKNKKTLIQKDMCTPMFTAAFFTTAKI